MVLLFGSIAAWWGLANGIQGQRTSPSTDAMTPYPVLDDGPARVVAFQTLPWRARRNLPRRRGA
jgi:hypothetical protein